MNNVIEIELMFHFHNIFVVNYINRIIFVILKRFVYDFINRFLFENCKNENKKLIYSRDNDFNNYIAFNLNQNTLFILLCDINFQTNKILKFEIWNLLKRRRQNWQIYRLQNRKQVRWILKIRYEIKYFL